MSKLSNYLLPKLTELNYKNGLKEKLENFLQKHKTLTTFPNNEISIDTEITIKRFVAESYANFKQRYEFSDKILNDLNCLVDSYKNISIKELQSIIIKISFVLSEEDGQHICGLVFSSSLCEVVRNRDKRFDYQQDHNGLSIENKIKYLQNSLTVIRYCSSRSDDKYSLVNIFYCLLTSLYLLMNPSNELGFILAVDFLLHLHDKKDYIHRSDERYLMEATREGVCAMHSSSNLFVEYKSFKDQLIYMDPSGLFALIYDQSFFLFLCSNLSDNVVENESNWIYLTSQIVLGRQSLSNSLEFIENNIGKIGDVRLSKWICKDMKSLMDS